MHNDINDEIAAAVPPRQCVPRTGQDIDGMGAIRSNPGYMVIITVVR
jgi:hypothetical protein